MNFNFICLFLLFFFSEISAVIPEDFEPELYKSYVIKEMQRMRNVRPSFSSRFGWIVGLPYTAFFYMLLRGNEPWTFKNKIEDWFQTDSAWKVSILQQLIFQDSKCYF